MELGFKEDNTKSIPDIGRSEFLEKFLAFYKKSSNYWDQENYYINIPFTLNGQKRIPDYALLKCLINYLPLNKYNIIKAATEINSFIFMPSKKDDYYGNECYGYLRDWKNNFKKIIIYNNYSQKQQQVTLIHELGHIHYRVMGESFEKHSSKIESLLTMEAERFVCENKDFIGDLIKKLNNNNNNNNNKCFNNKKIDNFMK